VRPNRLLARLRRGRPAELGIAAGAVLALFGLGYLLLALARWREVGFGPLSYPDSLRIVVPAVTALALAIQLAFAGFALAVLDLGREVRLQRVRR
jgi:hypothetical protein